MAKKTTPTVPPIKIQRHGWVPPVSILSFGGRGFGRTEKMKVFRDSLVQAMEIHIVVGKTLDEVVAYTYVDEPVTISFDTSKTMKDLTTADLHQMLGEGYYPSFLTVSQKERIKELYENGKQFDAVRKIKGIIERLPKEALL